ncbi:MAG: hypothetical protein ACC631_03590 [Halocynthiibacter sp.]
MKNTNPHDPRGRQWSPEYPDDPELEALLAAAIRTNVGFLEPRDADIFWRVEILCQPLSQVAIETGLSKADLCRCLQSVRSDLVRLLVLSLQPPTDA